jgi:GNAT superfamily N-acetyltransferase
VQFRPLTVDDIGAIHALETDVYLPSLHESADAFARLIALFPDGAIGAFDADGMCGYVFGVPLRRGMMLELRSPLAAIPADADMFYVHDIAVAARGRGRGLGRQLAARLLDVARAHGFTYAELVSVQDSAPFWAAFGFRAVRAFEYAPGAPSIRMAARLA